MNSERRRIGITQRVVDVEDYAETRDCLDQAWTVFLGRLPVVSVPLPNRLADVVGYCTELDLKGFILTGGNDLSLDVYEPGPARRGVSSDRDATETAILDHAVAHRLPVLGVCRGLQVLQAYFGGRLVGVSDRGPDGHVATTHHISIVGGERNADRLVVNSYHNYGIAHGTLAAPLQPLAICSHDGTVEAARHPELPIAGIMWHPEREGPESWFHDWLMDDLFTTRKGVAA